MRTTPGFLFLILELIPYFFLCPEWLLGREERAESAICEHVVPLRHDMKAAPAARHDRVLLL